MGVFSFVKDIYRFSVFSLTGELLQGPLSEKLRRQEWRNECQWYVTFIILFGDGYLMVNKGTMVNWSESRLCCLTGQRQSINLKSVSLSCSTFLVLGTSMCLTSMDASAIESTSERRDFFFYKKIMPTILEAGNGSDEKKNRNGPRPRPRPTKFISSLRYWGASRAVWRVWNTSLHRGNIRAQFWLDQWRVFDRLLRR